MRLPNSLFQIKRWLIAGLVLLLFASMTFTTLAEDGTTPSSTSEQAEAFTDGYSYTCQNQSIDMIGAGMKHAYYGDLSNQSVTIPEDALWSTVQLGGGRYGAAVPDTVTFKENGLPLDTTTAPTQIEEAWHNMTGWTFEVSGQAGASYSLATDESGGVQGDDDKASEALVAYVGMPSQEKYTAVGQTHLEAVWGGDYGRGAVGPATLIMDLPEALPQTMDVHVKVAVMEKDPRCDGAGDATDPEITDDLCSREDHRILVLRARAGSDGNMVEAAETIIRNPDADAYQLNIETLTIPSVPAGTQHVEIELYAPVTPAGVSQFDIPGDEYEAYGDSGFLLGAVAWHDCVEDGTPTNETPTTTPTNETPTTTPTNETPTTTPTNETPTTTPTNETPTTTPTDGQCVIVQPELIVEPHNQTIKQGEEFTFTAKVPNTSQQDDVVTIIFEAHHFGVGQVGWQEIGRFENVVVPAGDTIEQVHYLGTGGARPYVHACGVINDCGETTHPAQPGCAGRSHPALHQCGSHIHRGQSADHHRNREPHAHPSARLLPGNARPAEL